MIDKFEGYARILLSILFFGLGSCAFVFSYYTFTLPVIVVSKADVSEKYKARCKEAIQGRGTLISETGTGLQFAKRGIRDHAATLQDFSVIAASCTGYNILSVCINNECVGNNPGITMLLTMDPKLAPSEKKLSTDENSNVGAFDRFLVMASEYIPFLSSSKEEGLPQQSAVK